MKHFALEVALKCMASINAVTVTSGCKIILKVYIGSWQKDFVHSDQRKRKVKSDRKIKIINELKSNKTNIVHANMTSQMMSEGDYEPEGHLPKVVTFKSNKT